MPTLKNSIAMRLLFAALIPVTLSIANSAEQPNIIVLLADDLGLPGDLTSQVLEIPPRHAFFPGHNFIAGAVVANVVTKRQVYIE